MSSPRVAVLGAGKVGTVLARLAVAAGRPTAIAGSGDPSALGLIVDVLAPGAVPMTAADAAGQADIVLVAVPLARLDSVPASALRGKIVIDVMNYWPPVDGVLPLWESATPSSSEIVRDVLGVDVVKSFNHMGYHELDAWTRPSGDPDRRALAVAGDDPAAVEVVAELVDAMGFDPVLLAPLSAGRVLQPGSSDIFGANLTRAELLSTLDNLGVAPAAACP
ncbi:NADPH-dependent F420 reductase [Asanoa iriomotensis]|uniref:NADP oxidoreductase n=1 Tax=Asanoa iriomotensis TaxID=234613 RepID=A0ABQ4C1R8_9ACTN|nr:NAD(P)-binding domain-containing protein [Asanoa iriomotensis]GIF56718.1 NADP oxidoreductase [Asanoa iriomotensis]